MRRLLAVWAAVVAAVVAAAVAPVAGLLPGPGPSPAAASRPETGRPADRVGAATLAVTAIDLGTLGGKESFADNVSGSLVYGTAETTTGVRHAFVTDLAAPDHQLLDIGALVPRPQLPSHVIDADGPVMVGATVDAATQTSQPFAFDLATRQVFPLPIADPVAVSGHLVVGNAMVGGHERAFAYNLASPATPPVDLGTLGGTSSKVVDISGTTAVGSSTLATRGMEHTFAYDLVAAQPRMVDLTPEVFAAWPSFVGGTVVVGSAQRTRPDWHAHPFFLDFATAPARAAYLWRRDGWPTGTDGHVMLTYEGVETVATQVAFPPSHKVVVKFPAGTEIGLLPVSDGVVAGLDYTGSLGERAFLYDLGAPRPVAVDLPRAVGPGRLLPFFVDDERGGAYVFSWVHDLEDGLAVGAAVVHGHRHAMAWRVSRAATPLVSPARKVVRAAEGRVAVVVLRRTGDLSAASTVSYGTNQVRYTETSGTSGWARGPDFQAVHGTLSFRPGQRTARIRIPILRDRLFEPAETFFLTLGDARGAALRTPAEVGVKIAAD